MGTYDTIRFLDDDRKVATCSAGHPLVELQTKDLDGGFDTYFVHHDRLYSSAQAARFHDGLSTWRVEGEEAVHETRYKLEPVRRAETLRVYGYCRQCEPILIRSVRATLHGDLVDEREVFVEFKLTIEPDQRLRMERVKGSRKDEAESQKSHGYYVLEDDEPLAIAHRELKKAKAAMAKAQGVDDEYD